MRLSTFYFRAENILLAIVAFSLATFAQGTSKEYRHPAKSQSGCAEAAVVFDEARVALYEPNLQTGTLSVRFSYSPPSGYLILRADVYCDAGNKLVVAMENHGASIKTLVVKVEDSGQKEVLSSFAGVNNVIADSGDVWLVTATGSKVQPFRPTFGGRDYIGIETLNLSQGTSNGPSVISVPNYRSSQSIGNKKWVLMLDDLVTYNTQDQTVQLLPKPCPSAALNGALNVFTRAGSVGGSKTVCLYLDGPNKTPKLSYADGEKGTETYAISPQLASIGFYAFLVDSLLISDGTQSRLIDFSRKSIHNNLLSGLKNLRVLAAARGEFGIFVVTKSSDGRNKMVLRYLNTNGEDLVRPVEMNGKSLDIDLRSTYSHGDGFYGSISE